MSRRYLVLAAKLAVAAVLVGWLLHSGTLDLGALRVFFERPELLAMDLAVFSTGVVLGALRWRLLLRFANVEISVGRALQLHLAAMFFNVVLPGNIGGDVYKSIIVARTAAPEMRATVYVVGLLDRLIALAGLVVVALALIAVHGGTFAAPVVVLAVLTFGGPIALMLIVRWSGERWTNVRVIGRVIAALRLLTPGRLAAALGLAVVVHATGMLLFAVLASSITAGDPATFASIYPLGMLTMVIPISYAGIGVGHVAFDQLFSLVGMTGGATAFNLYLIGQTLPCLAGAVPYMMLRDDGRRDPADPGA